MRGMSYSMKAPPWGNGWMPPNIPVLLKRKRDNAPDMFIASSSPKYARLRRPPVPLNSQPLGHIASSDTMVVPHSISDPEREAWMRWRLVPVEHQIGARAVVNGNSIQLAAKAGSLSRHAKIAVEKVVEEACNLVELTIDVGQGAKYAKDDYISMIRPLVEQYGMRVRSGNAATLKIVGPNQPAHDAAALLWAACAQGESAAIVIQAPGQIQALPAQMLTDFEGDLKTMEDEFNVKMHKYHTMMGVAGACQRSALQARRTLQEMLMFYLPDEFLLLSGLSHQGLVQLRTTAGLKALILKLGCTMSLDDSDSTAWICGKNCMEVQTHIEAVLAGQNPFLPPPELETGGLDLQQDKSEAKRPPLIVDRVQAHDVKSSMNISLPLDKEAQQRLDEAVMFGGPQALRTMLDPTDELLWPEGEMRNLSWDNLEQFWADACILPMKGQRNLQPRDASCDGS